MDNDESGLTKRRVAYGRTFFCWLDDCIVAGGRDQLSTDSFALSTKLEMLTTEVMG